MQHLNRIDGDLVQILEEEFGRLLIRTPSWDEQSITDRIRRSLSWMKRATHVSENDTPSRFVELWISLNALYGCRPYDKDFKPNERRDFKYFFRRLATIDQSTKCLPGLMKRIDKRVYNLIGNKYLWNEFWRGDFSEQVKAAKFARSECENAIKIGDVEIFFTSLFERLLILRNQIFHGSSSENTEKSRDALIPGLIVLEQILPVFLRLLIHHSSRKDWPLVPYPGKGTPQHPV